MTDSTKLFTVYGFNTLNRLVYHPEVTFTNMEDINTYLEKEFGHNLERTSISTWTHRFGTRYIAKNIYEQV